MATHVLEYGTLETGKPFIHQGYSPGERGWWLRMDQYRSNNPADGVVVIMETIACQDQYDDTRPIDHNYPGAEYNAKCSSCWLHRHHTLALHNAYLQTRTERKEVAV